jgi:cellulose synthase/poly-beta-1,6-N-acetylglucosamine synthase-like glycosyltransferase
VEQLAIFSTHLILTIITLILAVPILTLSVQCCAALLPKQTQPDQPTAPSPRTTILMPAYNEAAGIGVVIEALLSQMGKQDQLVVIADNCTDATATIARAQGATVLERQDSERRGKGYALDYGMQFLKIDPPEIVVIVDADCIVEPHALAQIVQRAATTGRPVQSTYLMEHPDQTKPRDAVSTFAFRVKNFVRPRGLEQLGLPCLLTGTGMAFPWSVLQKVSLASGHLVEDMKLAVDLAIAGHPATFHADANVTGLLPKQENAAKSQRTRWEHGHLQVLLTQVPRLVRAAIAQKRFDLLVIALDLFIPPLSFLVILWITGASLSLLVSFFGITMPLIFIGCEGLLLLMTIFSTWAKFGRADLPAQTLLTVPFYILWKIPLYLNFVIRPQKTWVRTERDAIEPK